LAGHFHTPSRGIEDEAVVAAAKVLSGHFAARKRCRAVAAAILKRRGFSVGAAEQHDRLTQKGAAYWRTGEILRPDRCVPAVFRKLHAFAPWFRATLSLFQFSGNKSLLYG